MNCDKAQELFSELHEETLAEALRFKVNRHLQDCPACAHEFEVFQRNYGLFSMFSPVPVPDDLGELIARKLDRKQDLIPLFPRLRRHTPRRRLTRDDGREHVG